jgi:Gametolysin peptidase M11
VASIDWPWAIVLCRFSDLPAVPQPPQYYVDLYTQNGAGGIADYWREVSCNTLDLTGSAVFGWLTMSHPSSDVATLTFPGERWKLVQWGLDAAQANGINLAPFRQVLVVHNYGVDHGYAGNGVVVVHSTPTLCEFGFICHEMGHGMGLNHSWAANPDFQYGDGWDVMSFATTTFQWTTTFQATQGAATVGLNAHNLEVLTAMPAGRTWQPPGPDFSETVVLDPLSQPAVGNHGSLVVKIPPTATRPPRPSASVYEVEFRQKAGWDQAIPENSVTIREIRTDGNSYLQPGIGQRFMAGTQFVSADPKVFINIISIDSTPTASLRMWDVPDGCLRKEDSKPKVYLMENGTKRWVTSPAVLFALGKTWADVRSVPDGGLVSIPDGPDVQLLTVSVTPYPVPVNRSVTVTVSAPDVSTGTDVHGQVFVNGVVIGTTGTPITHNFQTKRVRIPGTRPPEWEVVYPAGVVKAAAYPDVDIDFGFP